MFTNPKIIKMKRELENVKHKYIKLLFKELIKPFIDNNNLEIVWANGTFFITDANCEDVALPDHINVALTNFVVDVYPHSKCCAVWDVLGSMYTSGCYNQADGFKDFEQMRKK